MYLSPFFYFTDLDMCKQIICLNGGKCDQVLGSYKCTCLPGWTGQYCGTSMKFDTFYLYFLRVD